MKSCVRIVQLVTQREAAGAQTVAVNLHEGLRCAGVHSELWFFYRKRDCFEDIPHTVDFVPAPWTAAAIPAMVWRYRNALKRFAPDVVIAHTHYATVIGLSLARLCGVQRRIAVHHNAVNTYPTLARLMTRALSSIQVADSHVGVADHVCASLEGKSVLRIYNGVAAPAAVLPSRNEARLQLGVPSDVKLLVNVGRLSRQKNQSFLLRLMAKLHNQRLVIVGEGEDRRQLEYSVRRLGIIGRVSFTGQLPPATVRLWMIAADVFVFPSHFEAMPVALVEAMQLGVPILASDIAAHQEVTGDTVTLLPLSERLWLERLGSSMSADTQCSMRRATQFSIDAMVGEYLKLVQELV